MSASYLRVALRASEVTQRKKPIIPTKGTGLAVFGSVTGAGSGARAGAGAGLAAATGTGAGTGSSIKRTGCGGGVAGLGGGGAVPVVARPPQR